MDLKYFKISTTPSNTQLDLLNKNVIGTPGLSMLYQHLGVGNKIDKIANPIYVNLERNNNILGTCCFCNRLTLNDGKRIDAFYIRYFSFKDKFRRKNISDKSKLDRNSKIRREINDLLKGGVFGKSADDKFFHYAYVDPRNIRSVELCNEFGFETVRNYTTIIFNRIAPKDNKSVFSILPPEVDAVKELLRIFYNDYTMFSDENLFNMRKYYVVKDEKGTIVAGVGVNPEHWRIHQLPGLTGKIILNTFSYIPILKLLFNKDYHFLTMEGVFFLPGYEKQLEVLFESLLARYGKNHAITCIDSESKLYNVLSSLELGIVDKLNKRVIGNTICKFINFTQEEKQLFKTKPSYISGIDVT